MTQNETDRYEVIDRIGSGGMATVYKATDTVLQRIVALKLLTNKADDTLKQQFQAEARAVANLNHQNIVGVYDVGERDGWPYMVMEYVEGTNLKHVIQDNGALPLTDVMNIVSQISAALEYAHNRGLIHCDVKPHNILLRSDGRAKLVDFGVAQALLNRERPSSDQVLGTPLYMAPEQAAGESVTPATDVYGLGLVLWEAATGIAPAKPDPDGPIYLDYARADLPRNVIRVIEQATAEAPEDRYQSVTEMMTALRRPDAAEENTVAFAPVSSSVPRNDVTQRQASMPRTRAAASPRRETARPVRRRRSGFAFLPLAALIILILALAVYYIGSRVSPGLLGSPGSNPGAVPPTSTVVPTTSASSLGQTGNEAATPSPKSNAKYVVQLLARGQDVQVEVQENNRVFTRHLSPGQYMEVSASRYLKIAGDPARHLYINVHSQRVNTQGTLAQVASEFNGGKPVTTSKAFIYLGSL